MEQDRSETNGIKKTNVISTEDDRVITILESTEINVRKKANGDAKNRPNKPHSKHRSSSKRRTLGDNKNENFTDKKIVSTKSIQRRPAIRPEPEGELAHDIESLDECDRILNCDNPLFSDVEANEEFDEQIKIELDRLHKRSTDVFAVAQMIQSNTLLKFAIIQTELKNITDSALRRVSFQLMNK